MQLKASVLESHDVSPDGRRSGGLDLGESGSGRRRADPHVLDIIPANAGPRLATAGGGAIHSIREPGSQAVLAENHFAAVMLSPAPGNRAALGSDRMREYDAPVGALVIQPMNVDGRAIWSCTRETVIIALRPETLAELAARELDSGEVALQPPAFGTVDPTALRIAELLKFELTHQATANELYVDCLVTLFGIHLLRTYSGAGRPPARARGGLSASSARRVLEFLNEHFSRKLTVAELAAISGLSPSHFIGAFTKTFGQPPHQYLLALRLALAEKLLAENVMTIAEIAYVSGFSSQSHLTAAMRKYRGRTPADIRLGR